MQQYLHGGLPQKRLRKILSQALAPIDLFNRLPPSGRGFAIACNGQIHRASIFPTDRDSRMKTAGFVKNIHDIHPAFSLHIGPGDSAIVGPEIIKRFFQHIHVVSGSFRGNFAAGTEHKSTRGFFPFRNDLSTAVIDLFGFGGQ